MDAGGLRERLHEWAPHGSVGTQEELLAFHDRVSVRRGLKRRGIHPVVLSVGFPAVIVAPGVVLTRGFGVDHPLLTEPMLGVLFCNTVITLAGLFFVDRRFPRVMVEIRPAFDLDAERYYGFVASAFETLYDYSMYAPVAAGSSGRRRPKFLAAVLGFYGFWLAAIAAVAPTALPAAPAARWLFVGYYALVVAWAAMTLFTVVAFIAITCLYFSVRVSRFSIRLKIMRRYANFGLEPYGRFLFHKLFFGLTAVAVAGIASVATGNPLLLLFTSMATPLLVVWFVGIQYGLHDAMVSTKRSRLRQLDEAYADELDRVFLSSTPEPDMETIHDSNSFLQIKNEVESLPNWPTSMKTVYQVITTILVSNIPSAIALFT